MKNGNGNGKSGNGSKVSRIVSKMRAAASIMKVGKGAIANKAVDKLDGVQASFEHIVQIYKTMCVAAEAGVTITHEIMHNSVLRKRATTLVSNLVGDMSNRVNEVADIFEAASKNPHIVESVEQLVVSFTKLEKSTNTMRKRMQSANNKKTSRKVTPKKVKIRLVDPVSSDSIQYQ